MHLSITYRTLLIAKAKFIRILEQIRAANLNPTIILYCPQYQKKPLQKIVRKDLTHLTGGAITFKKGVITLEPHSNEIILQDISEEIFDAFFTDL